MTVKCLSEVDQAYVCDAFSEKTMTLNELAYNFEVSRRTIVRVLEDHQIDPGVRHRKPKVKPQIGIYLPGPPAVEELRFQPKPWYRRVLEFVGIRA